MFSKRLIWGVKPCYWNWNVIHSLPSSSFSSTNRPFIIERRCTICDLYAWLCWLGAPIMIRCYRVFVCCAFSHISRWPQIGQFPFNWSWMKYRYISNTHSFIFVSLRFVRCYLCFKCFNRNLVFFFSIFLRHHFPIHWLVKHTTTLTTSAKSIGRLNKIDSNFNVSLPKKRKLDPMMKRCNNRTRTHTNKNYGKP